MRYKSYILIFFLILFSQMVTAQQTTYSKEEERMVFYLNQQWAYAEKWDSTEILLDAIDSSYRFLEKFPNSFAKLNVYRYLFEMTIEVSTDTSLIFSLIDTVLTNDKLPSTKLGVGETLIRAGFDLEKGISLIEESYSDLTFDRHQFMAHLYLARAEAMLGNSQRAKYNYIQALSIDSTKSHIWYEYLSFLSAHESPDIQRSVSKKIEYLEEQATFDYLEQSTSSKNIHKDLSSFIVTDIKGSELHFSDYLRKPTVINFFNFWCSASAKELPVLNKLREDYPQINFVFLTVSESPEELKHKYFSKPEFKFMEKCTVGIESYDIFNQLSRSGMPQTLVLDKNGKVRFDYLGYHENIDSLLRDNFALLLNE